MTDPRTLSPDDAQLAAEYALGLLQDPERAQAASRTAVDPLFGEEVARWRGRLAPMLDEIAPADPPESSWTAIASRTGVPGAPGDNVVQLKRRVQMWRGFTGAATALAASLALVLVMRPQPEPAPIAPTVRAAPMVASLASDKGDPMLMATWDPVSERLVIAAAGAMPAPPGHSHEVWLIPAGGSPMKVGMLPRTARMHMQVPDDIAQELRNGATLAVSVEPMGGSPTGLPTGPVVASGALETS